MNARAFPNIALSGTSGSGKSTIARHLVVQYGYQRLSPGDMCRQIAQLVFNRTNKTTLNKVNDGLKAIDPFVWINACLRNAEPGVPVVFDSMRFMMDWEFFRNRKYVLVRVSAPLHVRSHRLHSRGQKFLVGVDDKHSGETELDEASFDRVFENMFEDPQELLIDFDAWMKSLRVNEE